MIRRVAVFLVWALVIYIAAYVMVAMFNSLLHGHA